MTTETHNMNILYVPMCLIGRHHRSKKRVRRAEHGIFRSICIGCGKPMWRGKAGWLMTSPLVHFDET
jgi:hypothetical protein